MPETLTTLQVKAQVAHALGMSRQEPWTVLERALKQRLQSKPDAPSTVPRVLIAERELAAVRVVLADGIQHTDAEGRPLSVAALARRRMEERSQVCDGERAPAEKFCDLAALEAAERKLDVWQKTAAAMETRARHAEEQEQRAKEALSVLMDELSGVRTALHLAGSPDAEVVGDRPGVLVGQIIPLAERVRRLGMSGPSKPTTATQTIRAWSTDPEHRVPPPLAEPPVPRFTLLAGNFLGHRWKGHEVLMDAKTGKPLAVGNHPKFRSGEREALGDATPVSLLSLQGLLGLLNELMTTEGK